jgi:hypothetical protein
MKISHQASAPGFANVTPNLGRLIDLNQKSPAEVTSWK